MGVELSGCVNCMRWFFIFSNIPVLVREWLSSALSIACGVLLVAVSIVGIIGAWGKWRPLLLVVS